MEYLMTYGWAILIIAIVVGVLYYLGVFSSASLAPRAQPGSCQVFRPNGPGTSYDAALSGTCQGELPEYVAQFNGATSVINTGSSSSLQPNVFTVTAWIKYTVPSGGCQCASLFSFSGASTLPAIYPYYSSSGALIYLAPNNYRYFSYSPINTNDGNWHFVVFVVTGNGQSDISNSIMYADGRSESVPATDAAAPPTAKTGPFIIGEGNGAYFQGLISNVQIYNTSLSANEVTALYNEGIGGAPINPAYIVGWWPLNGNPNDYSGNLNQGTATAVAYTSSWTSGYSAP